MWCGRDSSTVFGQWPSGMARTYRAAGDTVMRDKALHLCTEWAKTIRPDGDPGIQGTHFKWVSGTGKVGPGNIGCVAPRED